jgi:glyoxylase-like metal-dependent hydrolase (beta-lactamase superfamily II)
MTADGAGVVDEVGPGLFRLEQTDGSRRLCQFVVRGEAQALLVDSGLPTTPATATLPFLRSLLRPSTRASLVLTHQDADHCGGTAGLRAGWPDLEVVAHSEESPPMGDPGGTISQRYEPFASTDGIILSEEERARVQSRLGGAFTVDKRLSSEPVLDIGGRRCQVLHVPGHSAGHLALWLPDEAALICGDAVMADGIRNRDGSLLFPPQFISPATYMATIGRLKELHAAVLLCAHEPVLKGDRVCAFFDKSEEAAKRIMDLVEGSLTGAPSTLRQLCAAVHRGYGPLPPARELDLAASVSGCLQELIDQDRALSRASGTGRTFQKGTR